jgi:hypothetical protein
LGSTQKEISNDLFTFGTQSFEKVQIRQRFFLVPKAALARRESQRNSMRCISLKRCSVAQW